MRSIMSAITAILVGLSTIQAADAAGKPKTEREQHQNNPKLPDGWRVHDLDRPLPPGVTPGATPADAPRATYPAQAPRARSAPLATAA